MAFGSGFSIFEQGAKASGMAGAFVATADDPSAIFYNVAGIAQQRQMTILAGATFINFNNEFEGDANDPFAAGTTGQFDRHLFIPPNGYAIIPIGTNLTFGVGMFSNYGLRTDWEDPWVGRFSSRDVNLKTVTLEPALAWQNGTGSVAVGAGLQYRRGRVTLSRNQAAINPFTGRIVDVANAYLSSEWGSEYGWSAGVLLKPTPTLRIGANYHAPMDLELEGDADFIQIPTGNAQFDAIVGAGLPPDQGITTTIPFPATLSVGIATSAIATWDIEFDITHTTWSRFETLLVEFDQTPANNLNRPQNWEDTFSYRLGANKRATENVDIRLGLVFDENPQPVEAVSPLLPDADRIGATMGLGFRHGPFIFDASAMFLHFQDRSTEGVSEDINGTYRTNANLYSVNLGYRF
ncbi:MAG TPA: outer membrane protein transport protein [Thermoanaerobaculia bacterium]